MDAPFPEGMLQEIEDFFTLDLHNESFDGRIVHAVFHSRHFFPLQRKNELRQMLKIAGSFSPKVVFEIGADKGGGLLHWCKLPTVERIIACEIRGLPYRFAFEKAFPHIEFLWLEGSSYHLDQVEQVENFLGEDKIDCLFIDGDKQGFLLDFNCYTPYMKGKGKSVIFMHDIQDLPHPGNAFLEVSKYFQTLRLIDTTEAIDQHFKKAEDPSAWEAWLNYWNGKSCGVGVILL